MKSIVSLVVVLMLGLVSGLVYMLVRPAAKRTSDWQRLKAVPSHVKGYFTKLFASKPATGPAIETPAAQAA